MTNNLNFAQTGEGPLTELFSQCIDKTPEERAALLTTSVSLSSAHANSAAIGQTATPALEDEVDLHFVAFVEHKGYLIELDGRRHSPVNHGPIRVGLLEVRVFSGQLHVFRTNVCLEIHNKGHS